MPGIPMPDELIHHHGPSWAAEPTFGQTAAAIHTGDSTAHILNAMRTGAVQDSVGHNAILGGQRDMTGDFRDSVHGANRDLASGQRDLLGSTGSGFRDLLGEVSGGNSQILRELCDVRGDIHQDGSATRSAVGEEGRFVGQAINDHRRETTKDHCDIQEVVRAEGRATEKGLCDVRVEAQNNLSTLRRDICEVDHNVTKQACETREVVKDQVRELLLGQCDIREKMATQHCDIKMLVTAENQQTRDLLNNRALRETERELDSERIARLIDRETIRGERTEGLLNQLIAGLLGRPGN